ncbi:PREDICTED: uncharacterized protein LOC106114071 isoform X1 [Papilio xuthus]|uniref:Uncharacterized protein LOC106114071 isoform X1 n=3 Tax=Papilio xuthus TaxID=66420 RepID=A0AAJ7E4N1_PAPXU|nr:PREDICTED: uncharacterized protein LOC106114071 isoform X1 [Papilio xuthus]
MQVNKIKTTLKFLRSPSMLQSKLRCLPTIRHNFTSTVDVMDVFTNELLKQDKPKSDICSVSNLFSGKEIRLSYYSKDDNNTNNYVEMTNEEIDNSLLDLLSKNKNKQVVDLVKMCTNNRKLISMNTIKRLFRTYSIAGKPDIIVILQQYCYNVDYGLYKRNGEFLHYLAKAHCFKGNAEKGLTILSNCYKKYEGLRGFYRIIFRELIQDTILNRSEASLVIFKKYVLEFSKKWNDDYPLVCFWHMCWSSTWFSDQMLSNELLETSEKLQNIVRDKATIFSINILREYNEDAVVSLMQSLLKYKMMTEYTKVLQLLFNYKLRNRDLRGCREIVRNCEALGIKLPSDQQGRYIRMLINNEIPEEKSITKPTLNFKLKF